MMNLFETIIAKLWNRVRGRGRGAWHDGGSLDVGERVVDGEATRHHVKFSTTRRTTHIVVHGKTGSGKSSLLRYWATQDIQANRGFVYFDFHGVDTEYFLRVVNTLERKERRHLSERLILIDPGDATSAIGINPLEQESPDFVRIAEIANLLKLRWNLHHFGARTDELLRNALFTLVANHLTLVELTLLLTNAAVRAQCLKQVPNPDVRHYFQSRYDQASEAMQATMREPLLNKTSAFTADPKFRAIIGQERSTISFRQAMDQGQWIIVNLNKGRLGEQAFTLGSLIFTMLKNALFAREKRSLFTFFCDEVQNLATGGGIETLLSEARKFGVGLVSSNQHFGQHSPEMRAALLSAGTHVFFQLSSEDAAHASQMLDGGRSLTERLKNLPQRHCIVKSGSDLRVEVRVPTILEPRVDYSDLWHRLHNEHTRSRVDIEREIAERHARLERTTEVLHDWE